MSASVRKFIGIVSIFGLYLNSCTILKPGLIGQDSFQSNAIEMKVSGRYGWTFNKTIKYGTFYTTKFNSGLTKINHDVPDGWHFDLFESDYADAQQRFSFKQFDSKGNSIEVLCTAKRRAKTIHYSKSLSGEDVLVENYEVLFYQNNNEISLKYCQKIDSTSNISFETDTFAITNDYKYDQKSKKIFNGIVIKDKNNVLAAVDVTNEGIVWIRNDLDNTTKLRLAAISTAILLKPNLENAK